MQEPDWGTITCVESLRSVLKWEIQLLIQRLSETGEESVVLTVNLGGGPSSELGSRRGQDFLQIPEIRSVKSKFIKYCQGWSEVSTNIEEDLNSLDRGDRLGADVIHLEPAMVSEVLDQVDEGDPVMQDKEAGGCKMRDITNGQAKYLGTSSRRKRKPTRIIYKQDSSESDEELVDLIRLHDTDHHMVNQSECLNRIESHSDGNRLTGLDDCDQEADGCSESIDDGTDRNNGGTDYLSDIWNEVHAKGIHNVFRNLNRFTSETGPSDWNDSSGNVTTSELDLVVNGSKSSVQDNMPKSLIHDYVPSVVKSSCQDSEVNVAQFSAQDYVPIVPKCTIQCDLKQKLNARVKKKPKRLAKVFLKADKLRNGVVSDGGKCVDGKQSTLASEGSAPVSQSLVPGHQDGVPVDEDGILVSENRITVRQNDVPASENLVPVRLNEVPDNGDGVPVQQKGVVPPAENVKAVDRTIHNITLEGVRNMVPDSKMVDSFTLEDLEKFRIPVARPPGNGFKEVSSDEMPGQTVLLDSSKRGVGKYQCPWCCLIVRDRHDLKRHLRTHTKEKPYCCSVCLKKFSRKWDLENHLRRHQDENYNERLLLKAPVKMIDLNDSRIGVECSQSKRCKTSQSCGPENQSVILAETSVNQSVVLQDMPVNQSVVLTEASVNQSKQEVNSENQAGIEEVAQSIDGHDDSDDNS